MPNGSSIYDNPTWAWFCGAEWAYQIFGNTTTKALEINNCFVNLIDSALQVAFIFIFLLILIIKRLRWKPCKQPRFLLIWPGHFLRWTLTFLQLVLCIASIAEGILSHLVRQNQNETTPQLYLPASLLLIATITSLVYYQLAEIWRTPGMCWILIGYWVICLATGGIRIAMFHEEAVPLDTTALWITILMTVIQVVLLLVEFNVIRVNFTSSVSTINLNGKFIFVIFVPPALPDSFPTSSSSFFFSLYLPPHCSLSRPSLLPPYPHLYPPIPPLVLVLILRVHILLRAFLFSTLLLLFRFPLSAVLACPLPPPTTPPRANVIYHAGKLPYQVRSFSGVQRNKP